MTVYIDADYRCRLQSAEGRTAVELEFFDGKCPLFIEGYRYVPPGAVWCRDDGVKFRGPMLSPVRDSWLLTAVQEFYEQLSPELNELKQKLQRLQDCVDGLAAIPSLEQLKDFLLAIREVLEDD